MQATRKRSETAGIVINPAAGSGAFPRGGAAVDLAESMLRSCRMRGIVRTTERHDTAGPIARAMLAGGATTLVAWGGDGTVNAVAAEAAESGAVLGIVPTGSGNGFARCMGLDGPPDVSLRTALTGPVRTIDTGEVNGRFFLNVTGTGLDARLAYAFNQLTRRGVLNYMPLVIGETIKCDGIACSVRTPAGRFETNALLVAVANGCEYGNGAVIAPHARPEDGLLDLVCIPKLSPLRMLRHAPRLFDRTLDRVPGVITASATEFEITADQPLAFHVDGEPAAEQRRLHVRIRPESLRMRVPPERHSHRTDRNSP